MRGRRDGGQTGFPKRRRHFSPVRAVRIRRTFFRIRNLLHKERFHHRELAVPYFYLRASPRQRNISYAVSEIRISNHALFHCFVFVPYFLLSCCVGRDKYARIFIKRSREPSSHRSFYARPLFIAPAQKEKGRKIAIQGIGGAFLLINFMYFANIIPPIPLALKDAGVYNDISRTPDGAYQVLAEKTDWRDMLAFQKIYPSHRATRFIFSAPFLRRQDYTRTLFTSGNILTKRNVRGRRQPK